MLVCIPLSPFCQDRRHACVSQQSCCASALSRPATRPAYLNINFSAGTVAQDSQPVDIQADYASADSDDDGAIPLVIKASLTASTTAAF